VYFAQPVSKKQALKEDLHQLNENLEFMLQNCKARRQGICAVRSTIMELLADELLRQVTIDQPERGLLLRRIRDEAKMTIEAYKCLHEAALQYGAQKLLDGARGTPEMVQRIDQLKKETEALHKEVKRLEARQASLVRCVEEQIQADNRRHNEEKAFLENSRKRLQQHLEDVKKMQEAERRALTEVS
jgi:dynein light intermediate chain